MGVRSIWNQGRTAMSAIVYSSLHSWHPAGTNKAGARHEGLTAREGGRTEQVAGVRATASTFAVAAAATMLYAARPTLQTKGGGAVGGGGGGSTAS